MSYANIDHPSGYIAMNWQNNYGYNDKGEETFECLQCGLIFVGNEVENCPSCKVKILWHG